MPQRLRLVTCAAFAACFLFSVAAFAQAPAPDPLQNLTASSLTMAALAGLVALMVSVYNTGSFFGLATAPKTWLPPIGVLIPFASAVSLSLHAAGVVTGLSVANALEQGFYALVGSGAGALLHGPLDRHLDQPRRMLALRKAIAEQTPKAVVLVLAAFALSQSACISVNPTVPVTPANQQQVSSCEGTATLHNGFVLGGIGLGGASTIVSGVAAATTNDKAAQVDLAIGAAIGAGLAAAAAGGAGLTAASFTSARCTDYVTPLPMKPKPGDAVLPAFSKLGETTVTMSRADR